MISCFVVLILMGCWQFYDWVSDREVSDSQYFFIAKIGVDCPTIKPMIASAMNDDKITTREYLKIVETANDELERMIVRINYREAEHAKTEIRKWRRER